MGNLGFRPPPELDFSVSNLSHAWKEWKQQFTFFLAAIGYADKKDSDNLKISSLLNIIGPNGVEVYNNMVFGEDEDKTKYATVLEKFDNYCEMRNPQMTLRAQYWAYQRPEGMSFEQYLTTIRTKARECKFTEENGMIRDKLFFDLKDRTTQLKVMGETGNSDLDVVITKIRMLECSKNELESLNPKTKSETVHVVSSHRGRGHGPSPRSHQSSENSHYSHGSQASGVSRPVSHSEFGRRKRKKPCGRCGSQHGPRECPAYGKSCRKCGGQNHFAKMCRSKKRGHGGHGVHVLEQYDMNQEETFFIDTLFEQNDSMNTDIIGDIGGMTEKVWMADIKLEHKRKSCHVEMKLDTGATANILPLRSYKRLRDKPPIVKSYTKLVAFGGQSVNHLGKIQLDCSVLVGGVNKTGRYEFYVADVSCPPILGLKACTELGLVVKGAEIPVVRSSSSNHGNQRQIDSVSRPYTKEIVLKEYEDRFDGGVGRFPQLYSATLDPDVKPVVQPPHRIPHSILPRLKNKLDSMEQHRFVDKVDEPTDWVSNLVVTEKKDGSLRICLDPKDLNKAIKREHFHIPTTKEVVSNLGGKKKFTIVDQRDSYWQVGLDAITARLTTFQTPFGRYCFNVLPFGLKSASEILQKRNYQVFGDIPGVYMISDDMIIAGADDKEHDEIFAKVMQRARENNVKFSAKKLQFKLDEVKFMGGIVGAEGLKPDPEKIRAIVNIPKPECAEDLERLLGMINYLSDYIPNKAAVVAPLRELLTRELKSRELLRKGLIQKSDTWHWTSEHEEALEKVKVILTSKPVLRLFDPDKQLLIQCDASSKGLGACLIQVGQPIAYASRSLIAAENYAQIEKELKAIVFSTERFNQYIYGRHTIVHSDHKPLEAITKKPLHNASPRLQMMLLQLMKYDLEVKWVPGKQMYIADTLSRAYSDAPPGEQRDQDDRCEEMEMRIHTLVTGLPVSQSRLDQLRQATDEDESLQEMKRILRKGWPNHIKSVNSELKSYWHIKDEIHEAEGLLFVGERLIIPASMRGLMLQKVHESHQGMDKCKSRARSVMYWPGMSRDIDDLVSRCGVCAKYRRQNEKEPLIPHEVPLLPWSKVGMDIFYYEGVDYLVIVDYRSKYPEVIKLRSKTAKSVIQACKETFARHGIPQTAIADNMPFASAELQEFAKEWDFEIITSSPTYPQSNGQAEAHVKIVKQMMRKALDEGKDWYLALMDYRNTPPVGLKYSPAEMLMSRRLRGNLPVSDNLLVPHVPTDVTEDLKGRQTRYKQYYDRSAKKLPSLEAGEGVRISKGRYWQPAIVERKHETPRSYVVQTQDGQTYRRNRRHLLKTAEPLPVMQPNMYDFEPEPKSKQVVVPTTNSGQSSNHENPVLSARSPVKAVSPPVSKTPVTPVLRTSGRATKPPAYLKDYDVKFK